MLAEPPSRPARRLARWCSISRCSSRAPRQHLARQVGRQRRGSHQPRNRAKHRRAAVHAGSSRTDAALPLCAGVVKLLSPDVLLLFIAFEFFFLLSETSIYDTERARRVFYLLRRNNCVHAPLPQEYFIVLHCMQVAIVNYVCAPWGGPLCKRTLLILTEYWSACVAN